MHRPKHPASAYTLFLQYERYQLMTSRIDEKGDKHDAGLSYNFISAADVDMAQQYSIQMDQQNKGKKPTNCDMDIAPKSSLGFADLARTVAARWKTLDESNKAVFEERAWIDKSRYHVQLYVWRRDRAAREDGRQLVLQEYK
jgi:hypothetical protein